MPAEHASQVYGKIKLYAKAVAVKMTNYDGIFGHHKNCVITVAKPTLSAAGTFRATYRLYRCAASPRFSVTLGIHSFAVLAID